VRNSRSEIHIPENVLKSAKNIVSKGEKSMKGIRKDKNGLKPIWVIVGLPMIIVILFAGILIYDDHQCHRDPQTPTIGTISHFNETRYFIHFDKVDPEPTPMNHSSFYIIDANGSELSAGSFSFYQFWNMDVNNSATNISFLDNDMDNNLSTGDSMFFRDIENGGYVDEGYKIILWFERNDDPMNGAGTVLRK